MKKLWILVALLLCFALPCVAEEEPTVYTSGDYKYILLEDGTAEISDYKGKEIALKIPQSFDGIPVTGIGDRAFWMTRTIKEVTIPNGVTYIGDYAFEFCDELQVIHISDTVSSIGSNIFSLCSKLEDVQVSLKHPVYATINGVLFDKREYELLCYPAGRFGSEYVVPKGILSIGDEAFQGCKRLKSISIPDSVTSIGNYAFVNSEQLETIELPDSLTNVGINPFVNCVSLSTIKVSPDHPTLALINGALFNKQEKKIIYYPILDGASEYTIPKGIVTIGESAFSNCTSLERVTVPETVIHIGESAFDRCYNLTNVILSDSLTDIDPWAFYLCTNLKEIKIPDSVREIKDYTFYECHALEKVTFSDELQSIGEWAFGNCESLANIVIPDSVTYIGEYAFDGFSIKSILVSRDSYAAQYCEENNLPYTYPDANDWLNN